MSAKGSANKGIVMIDENHYQNKLINDLKQYQSIGTQYSNGHIMSNIIEDISFVSSKNSFCMQFADILTYGMHRFINKNDDSIVRNIMPKFNRIYNDKLKRWDIHEIRIECKTNFQNIWTKLTNYLPKCDNNI